MNSNVYFNGQYGFAYNDTIQTKIGVLEFAIAWLFLLDGLEAWSGW